MIATSDRWDRCQALAEKLKQQSLAQATTRPQGSTPASPSPNESRSNEQ